MAYNHVMLKLHWFYTGGGGTPIYWLYGYVPLERVWFSSHLLWDCMGLAIIENWSRIGSRLTGLLSGQKIGGKGYIWYGVTN